MTGPSAGAWHAARGRWHPTPVQMGCHAAVGTATASAMNSNGTGTTAPGKRCPIRVEDSLGLSRAISNCANRGLQRLDFTREVCDLLLAFSGCDAIEIRLSDGELHYRWETTRRPKSGCRFERVRWAAAGDDGTTIPVFAVSSELELTCREVALSRLGPPRPGFTGGGSFWTGDTRRLIEPPEPTAGDGRRCIGGHYRSLVVIRFSVDAETIGLLHLKAEQPDYFTPAEVDFYERIAQTVGLAVAGRRAEAALRERVKELTCMYGIAHLAAQPELGLTETLRGVVELLPPAWQYPDNTAARLTLDGRHYATAGFRPTEYRLSADILVGEQRRGTVEVVYLEDRPELQAGVFLKEEEKLIEGVAREAASIVERKEAAEVKAKLYQQLAHADRLATIGKLTAGVAHELNEPLSSILGFAQLAQECPAVPEQASRDIRKVIQASLYAREIIRKLMVFSRQVPPQKTQVDLNHVIDDALYLLEGRCTKAGVRVVRDLAPQLPEVTADPSQCRQILVNLIVNAVQAMPNGGTLTVSTRPEGSVVTVSVEDTGMGMDKDTMEKVFLPFFTTKEVHEGTGLGLAVVHGIVTSHGGTIDVTSQLGRGAKFVVRLPVTRRDNG